MKRSRSRLTYAAAAVGSEMKRLSREGNEEETRRNGGRSQEEEAALSAATSLSCLVKRSRKQRRDATSAARRIIIAIIRCSRQSEAPRKSRLSRRPEERRDCVSIRYRITARASIAGTDAIPILFFFNEGERIIKNRLKKKMKILIHTVQCL